MQKKKINIIYIYYLNDYFADFSIMHVTQDKDKYKNRYVPLYDFYVPRTLRLYCNPTEDYKAVGFIKFED